MPSVNLSSADQTPVKSSDQDQPLPDPQYPKAPHLLISSDIPIPQSKSPSRVPHLVPVTGFRAEETDLTPLSSDMTSRNQKNETIMDKRPVQKRLERFQEDDFRSQIEPENQSISPKVRVLGLKEEELTQDARRVSDQYPNDTVNIYPYH